MKKTYSKAFPNGNSQNNNHKVEGHRNYSISGEEANQIYQKLFSQHQSHSDMKNIKKPWTDDESKLLYWSVEKYCKEKNVDGSGLGTKDWEKISLLVPGRNITQCHYKWSSTQKHLTNKKPWSVEEDLTLTDIIKEIGLNSWSAISQELNSKLQISRTGKQCRERWLNHLSPSISKDPWKLEEDIRLLEAQQKYGNKWSEISKIIIGRTENSVKNRFNCLLKKEKEEQIGKGLNSKSISDAMICAVKEDEDDIQWVESIIMKKRNEMALRVNNIAYEPLQESIKQEIHTYLDGDMKEPLTEAQKTCPNFRFLMRRNTLLKDSEKFVNPVTKQIMYIHPLGIYLEGNSSKLLNRICKIHRLFANSEK